MKKILLIFLSFFLNVNSVEFVKKISHKMFGPHALNRSSKDFQMFEKLLLKIDASDYLDFYIASTLTVNSLKNDFKIYKEYTISKDVLNRPIYEFCFQIILHQLNHFEKYKRFYFEKLSYFQKIESFFYLKIFNENDFYNLLAWFLNFEKSEIFTNYSNSVHYLAAQENCHTLPEFLIIWKNKEEFLLKNIEQFYPKVKIQAAAFEVLIDAEAAATAATVAAATEAAAAAATAATTATGTTAVTEVTEEIGQVAGDEEIVINGVGVVDESLTIAITQANIDIGNIGQISEDFEKVIKTESTTAIEELPKEPESESNPKSEEEIKEKPKETEKEKSEREQKEQKARDRDEELDPSKKRIREAKEAEDIKKEKIKKYESQESAKKSDPRGVGEKVFDKWKSLLNPKTFFKALFDVFFNPHSPTAEIAHPDASFIQKSVVWLKNVPGVIMHTFLEIMKMQSVMLSSSQISDWEDERQANAFIALAAKQKSESTQMAHELAKISTKYSIKMQKEMNDFNNQMSKISTAQQKLFDFHSKRQDQLSRSVSSYYSKNYFVSNSMLFDQMFFLSKMLTPSTIDWHNVFRIGNWQYDFNSNSFIQYQSIPFSSDKFKDQGDPVHGIMNSIFTDYIPKNYDEKYKILIECTLLNCEFPFCLAVIFNQARWASGVQDLLHQQRICGIYSKASKDINFIFAQTTFLNKSQRLIAQKNVLWALLNLIDDKKPLYVFNQEEKNQIINGNVKFLITIITGKLNVEVTLEQIKNEKTIKIFGPHLIEKCDPLLFSYHGLGFLSTGCSASFKIIKPIELVFSQKDIDSFKTSQGL